MNISKKTVSQSKQSDTPGMDKSVHTHVNSGIVNTLIRFAVSVNTALVVTRWKEYYYALNDYQLAQLGLTREEIPAELLRLLNHNQGQA